MTTLETLNQAVFLPLNADLSTAAWKLNIASVTADYLIYLIPLILVSLWYWGVNQRVTISRCQRLFFQADISKYGHESAMSQLHWK